MRVGAARKTYGIPYPTLYAVPGTVRHYYPDGLKNAAPDAPKHGDVITNEEAHAFNRIQRGHQNSLENIPVVMGLALVSWGFPIPSGFALISYAMGRVFYFLGYSKTVESRNNLLTVLLTYPALFTLWGLALATCVFLFLGVAPYSY